MFSLFLLMIVVYLIQTCSPAALIATQVEHMFIVSLSTGVEQLHAFVNISPRVWFRC